MLDGRRMVYYKDYINEDIYTAKIMKYRKKLICDDIICLDIETCNYYVDAAGKVYSIKDIFEKCKYRTDRIERAFEDYRPGALPYIWMMGIKSYVIYGRELKEIWEILKYIRERAQDAEVHIWVHNLSFEYQYLREIIPFEDKFFTDARQPLFAMYDNFTFRCSYRLTNLSLAKWGENNGIKKRVGDLDYFKMYTPKTKLTDEEMGYCKADIDIMRVGIGKYLEEYGHIYRIPYTQTGIVRRDIKAVDRKIEGFIQEVAYCQPKNMEEWKVQHCAYSGGLTLVNPAYCGKTLHNIISFDRKSAYPACMLYKFPNSPFVKTNIPVRWDDGNHHICLVCFHNLKARYNVTPLSSSKRVMISGAVYGKDNEKHNNGKIISADKFALYITEADYTYISAFYTWDRMDIISHWFATSDYMPKDIVEYMLQLYADKTLLKNGDPVIYLRKKEKLNSIYGMAASMLVHNEVEEMENYTYFVRKKTDEEGQEELASLQSKPYKNVLPYSWGLYITAFQRRDLMMMALKAGIDKLAYTDTDSLKGWYDESVRAVFEEENARRIAWTKERCAAQGIDYNLTCPKTPEGVPQYLGTWENDENYFECKFMGAKRYAYKKEKDGQIYITIAGVPKQARRVLKSVGSLRDGLTFDIFHSHKNMITYLDGDNPMVKFPDGYEVTNTCAANIRPTTYKLTLEREFKDLIRYHLNNKRILTF